MDLQSIDACQVSFFAENHYNMHTVRCMKQQSDAVPVIYEGLLRT